VVYVAICRCMKLEEADPLITAATRLLFGRMKR
jgi:hypothetical protein